MEDHGFFKYVWRINGIVWLVVGFLAIGILIFAGYEVYLQKTRDRNTRNIINIQQEADLQEQWQLGLMEEVEGTPYVMIPLISEQHYDQSYYGKSSLSARNYLFIDSRNNEKRWVLKSNENLIARLDQLADRNDTGGRGEAKAILFSVIRDDSDGDLRLTDKDRHAVAISRPDGSHYQELLAQVDHLIGYKLVDSETLLILYQKLGVGYSAKISLADFKLLERVELPSAGL